MSSIHPVEAFSEVSLDVLSRYLKVAGWSPIEHQGRSVLWLPPHAQEDLQIALPSSMAYEDASQDIEEAMATLAYWERRSRKELNDDISSGGADSISVRLVPDAPTGRAPLPLAHEAIGALRQLVVGSASALSNHSLVLPNRRPPLALSYVASTQLATEPGSFVLNLSLPLGAVDDPAGSQDTLMPASMGREVSNRIQAVAIKALSKASEVAADRADMSDFRDTSLELGNATELQALGELGGQDLDYQLRFTQSALSPGRRRPRLLAASKEQQKVLRDASEYLRANPLDAESTIEGVVVKLERKKASGPGDVTISAILDQSGKLRQCRVSLGEEDYKQAVEAHYSGRRVRITGELVIHSKSSELKRSHGFTVLPGVLS